MKKRNPLRARISKASGRTTIPAAMKPSPHASAAWPKDDRVFSTTKEDKRRIKRSNLISRIEKAHAKPLKRRRPSKKLITTLESLADALPTASELEASNEPHVVGDVRFQQRSLKSKPGALKKREKVERAERERFSLNMAQMSNMVPATAAAVATSSSNGKVPGKTQAQAQAQAKSAVVDTLLTTRWTALRDHIKLAHGVKS